MIGGVSQSDSSRRYSAFGTFLDTVQQGGTATAEEQPAANVSSGTVDSAETGAQAERPITRDLLKYLQTNGPQPVTALLQALGIGVLDLGNVLNALIEARMVELTKGADGEHVAITPLGEKIVTLP